MNHFAAKPGKDGGAVDKVPIEYLRNGYLDAKGNVHQALILDQAENIGRILSNGMATTQLRRFFNHARSIETRLDHGLPFETLRSELDKMHSIAMVAEKQNKARAPFADVIRRMVTAVRSERDFRKGFIPHFEAVVAYFTYYEKG